MISIVPALQRYLQSESILSAVASGGHWMPWAFPRSEVARDFPRDLLATNFAENVFSRALSTPKCGK